MRISEAVISSSEPYGFLTVEVKKKSLKSDSSPVKSLLLILCSLQIFVAFIIQTIGEGTWSNLSPS